MRTFLIPANDDAIRAVRLLTAGIADAAIEGQTRFEIAQADREMPAESGAQTSLSFSRPTKMAAEDW